MQFRENVAAWTCFHDRKDTFKGFLWRVLKLKEEVCVDFSRLIYVIFPSKMNRHVRSYLGRIQLISELAIYMSTLKFMIFSGAWRNLVLLF